MNPPIKEIPSDFRHRPRIATPPPEEPSFRPQLLTAAELMRMDLGHMRWAVDGIVPEGATILAGKPKMGKSWLAMHLAITVARGGQALGKIPVEPGPVHYLSLEDGTRRLQSRLRRFLDPQGQDWPQCLTFYTRWAKYKEGGLDALEKLMATDKPRLVIIDTLIRVRNNRSGNATLYSEDYEAISVLQQLALQHGVAVLIVTHVRKTPPLEPVDADPLEQVSGTMGLTGAADTVLTLRRKRFGTEAKLSITGRDVEEKDLQLSWHPAECRWILEGEIVGAPLNTEQRKIIAALQQVSRPLSVMQVLRLSDTSLRYDALQKCMIRMAKDGLIRKDGHGLYAANEPPGSEEERKP